MKKFLAPILLIISMFGYGNNDIISADTIKGDFDGDGQIEYVWLVAPETQDDDCIGDCTCYLKFSNSNIPSIKLENCIGGTPVNEGDLNEDGADEIGILPWWWTSCWHAYYVYTLKNHTWKYLVDPFSTHCDQWEQEIDAIQKDPSKKGRVIIRYMIMGDEDFKIHTKSIHVKN